MYLFSVNIRIAEGGRLLLWARGYGDIISADNLSFQHSVLYLDEGESADDDDPNAAEHDAQKIE